MDSASWNKLSKDAKQAWIKIPESDKRIILEARQHKPSGGSNSGSYRANVHEATKETDADTEKPVLEARKHEVSSTGEPKVVDFACDKAAQEQNREDNYTPGNDMLDIISKGGIKSNEAEYSIQQFMGQRTSRSVNNVEIDFDDGYCAFSHEFDNG